MMAYFTPEPLKLMISSRCKDKVPFNGNLEPMSEVRQAMKKELERIQFAGQQIFKVWIHEDEALSSGDQNSWDTCVDRARRADVFLVLFNGNAGWAGSFAQQGDHVGICHAEFEAAYNKTPSKVRSIRFTPMIEAEKDTPNGRFQAYFERLGMLGPEVNDGETAIIEALKASVAALLDLARAGVGEGSRGRYYAGEALHWSRMDYQRRRQATKEAVVTLLSEWSQKKIRRDFDNDNINDNNDNIVVYTVAGKQVAFVCDCIPAAMSTASARELVGQPFLKDHEICARLPRTTGGPVHVIACQKGVTESQALRQLGFPDALVVSAPFGVYVADDVQKIQMVFVANCRDETTTRHNVQRFLRWLVEQGEDQLLAKRAMSRRLICNLIARQLRASIYKS